MIFKNKKNRLTFIISTVAVFVVLIIGLTSLCLTPAGQEAISDMEELKKIENQKEEKEDKISKILPKITIKTALLEKNRFSRSGKPLNKINGIVVHYTANPGSTAMDNRNYFNNLKNQKEGKNRRTTYASSHFVIGLEGEIVQCVPLDEMAYASNERNKDTISIECCHPDKSGKFNNLTYSVLKEFVAYLCLKYDLNPEIQIIRHYDVTGKLCPLYYVKHKDEWEKFKDEVAFLIKEL